MPAIARIDSPPVSPPDGIPDQGRFDNALRDASDTTRPAPMPPSDVMALNQIKRNQLGSPPPETTTTAPTPPPVRAAQTTANTPEQLQVIAQTSDKRLDDTVTQLVSTQVDTATQVQNGVD